MRKTKISQLRRMMAQGDWHGALRMANSFARLKSKVQIQRAWSAYRNPEPYIQMGLDPKELFEQGKEALRNDYGR